MNRRDFVIGATGLASLASLVRAQQGKSRLRSEDRLEKGRRDEDDPRLPPARRDLTQLSILLGSVSDRSAKLSMLAAEAQDAVLSWHAQGDGEKRQNIRLEAGVVSEVQLRELRADTSYVYQLQRTRAGNQPGEVRDNRFHTQRRPGTSFAFTIQGDSHPERPQMFDAALYARTLDLIAADGADFHICMGDDFSLAKLREYTAQSIASRYTLQRPFLGIVGQASPLFLINGNHEQASLFNYNQEGIAHDVAVWAQQARNRLYPVPTPDWFFSGNTAERRGIGLMRDYCAWTWGDALFVILDCYWHSPACVDTHLNEEDDKGRGRERDWWGITLGDAQYQWLKKILEQSGAKFKFVFAHHVMGTGRGGVERAPFYEWGGAAERGGGDFRMHRPSWEMPIHPLMVKHKVNALFQGHDHLYVRQELDGVVYQTVPMPADWQYAASNEERYRSGTRQGNSGYLRVAVSADKALVEYRRSYREKDIALNRTHGEVTHRYTLLPRV